MAKNKSSNPTTYVLVIEHGVNKMKKFSYFKRKTKVGSSNHDLKRNVDSQIMPNTYSEETVCFYF